MKQNSRDRGKNKGEALGLQLLKELKKDEGFRGFTVEQTLYQQLGREIGRVRKARKLSDEEFAQRIKKKVRDVHRMEKGEFKQYTLKLILDIARAFDKQVRVEFDDL
jgi:ribosome-binding protein aMBF1 (putative translation factor)